MKRKGTGPDGLVVVDKPEGITSHGVVAKLRWLAGTRKVGHAGTLDPMATGVLVIGVERATRLLGHLMLTAKTYEATIRLGQTTITDDREGEVTASVPAGAVARDAIDAGIAEGPTMKAGTYALMTAVGGTAGRFIPDHGTAGYAEVVRDRDEMVRVVRRQVKDGADIIKIHVTGTVPTKSGELQVWTRDELKTVCDTAHDLGVRVTAHCRGDGATRDAVLAGCDIIWHASNMGEEALEAILEHRPAVAPVLTFLANVADYGKRAGAGPEALAMFQNEIERTGPMLRRVYDAGVPLMCGSESGFSITPYGHWHAREMEVFVEHLGLTPLEAITCATATSSIALDQQGEVGTIEVGRRADVLVVDGDPSVDVSILGDRSRLHAVYCRGRSVPLTPLPQRRPLKGERTMQWSTVPLTWELAHG